MKYLMARYAICHLTNMKKVKIYIPSKTAMQSGKGKQKKMDFRVLY